MFETSGDILKISSAAAIVAVATFFCIGMSYLIRIFKQAHRLTKGWSDRFKKVDEILDLVKEKIIGSVGWLGVIGEGVKQLVEFFRERKKKEKKEVIEE